MPTAASKNVTKGNPVCFSISQLEAARPDLTIPEVGSEEEKNLFFKVCENGQSWGQVDNVWFADISREVDMTNNRKHFVDSSQSNAIPVVEGRMVQQLRVVREENPSSTIHLVKCLMHCSNALVQHERGIVILQDRPMKEQ